MLRILFGLVVVACVSAPSLARAQMYIYNYNAAQYDRFTNDPAFIGADFDWSGVANKATMISPTHFIAAAHSSPTIGQTLTFYHGNSTLDFEQRTVTGLTQIVSEFGASDLMLGTLSSAVSNDVAIYPILVLPTIDDYGNLPIFSVGQSIDINSQRVGTNTIDPNSPYSTDPVFLADVDGSIGPVFLYDRDFVDGEALVQGGDSGLPSFAVYNGQLALVGLHWALETNLPASVDTFLPYYVNLLNAQLSASGESVTVVPEPSSLALAGLVAMWGVGRLVRRRTAGRLPLAS